MGKSSVVVVIIRDYRYIVQCPRRNILSITCFDMRIALGNHLLRVVKVPGGGSMNQIRERPLVERWAHGPPVRRRIDSVLNTVCETEHGTKDPSSRVVIFYRDEQ